MTVETFAIVAAALFAMGWIFLSIATGCFWGAGYGWLMLGTFCMSLSYVALIAARQKTREASEE